jgi:hypothetical protein
MAIEACCLWPTIWRRIGGEQIGVRAIALTAWKRLIRAGAAPLPDRPPPPPRRDLGRIAGASRTANHSHNSSDSNCPIV